MSRILPFPSPTHAALLAELNAMFAGIGMTVAAGANDDGEMSAERRRMIEREDGEVGIDLGDLPPLDAIHLYARHSESVVWHSHDRCPRWPVDAPMTRMLGRPGAGRGCRVCLGLHQRE